jgi:Flp pilus assembly protein TadB
VKTGHILSGALLLPLVIIIILAIAGITLNVWVYVFLAVVCPLAAGVVWFMYKDVEGKNEEKKGGRNRGG